MFGKIASLFVLTSTIAFCSALTAKPFEHIANGIWDTWVTINPNFTHGSVAVEATTDKVWLVSRRTYPKNANGSIDSASRGGIVSTLNLATKAWTHKTYNRLDTNDNTDKIFSLHGRLFMLTYNTNMNKIEYSKLFFWEDNSGRWLEMPFDIDSTATTTPTTTPYQHLSITVPDQSDNIAYIVASAYNGKDGDYAETVYCGLEVQFRGNVPMAASVEALMRHRPDVASGIRFMAVKGDQLIAFVDKFFKVSYGSNKTYAYVVDLGANTITNLTLNGHAHPMDFDFDVYQSGNEVFLVGGTQDEGSREFQMAIDVSVLNLTTLDWDFIQAAFTDEVGWSTAFDQKDKKLYVAGLSEGISVSQLN